jgi:hypothetical protein
MYPVFCMAFRHEQSLVSVTLVHAYGVMTAIIKYNIEMLNKVYGFVTHIVSRKSNEYCLLV